MKQSVFPLLSTVWRLIWGSDRDRCGKLSKRIHCRNLRQMFPCLTFFTTTIHLSWMALARVESLDLHKILIFTHSPTLDGNTSSSDNASHLTFFLTNSLLPGRLCGLPQMEKKCWDRPLQQGAASCTQSVTERGIITVGRLPFNRHTPCLLCLLINKVVRAESLRSQPQSRRSRVCGECERNNYEGQQLDCAGYPCWRI